MSENYGERLRGVEERAKSNSRRIERLTARQDDLEKLTSSLQAFAGEQEHIKADVQEIKEDVKTLTAKPGKRWELVLEKGLAAVIAILAGYLLAQVGLV